MKLNPFSHIFFSHFWLVICILGISEPCSRDHRMECLGYQGSNDNAMPFSFWFSSRIQLCGTLKRASCALRAVLGRCCPSQGHRPVLEDKEKRNCWTRGEKFHFPCTCFPLSPVTGSSGTKYIPNTRWNKQPTGLSSDGCSIRSCQGLHFIYLYFGRSNAKSKSQGRRGDVWHSVADLMNRI